MQLEVAAEVEDDMETQTAQHHHQLLQTKSQPLHLQDSSTVRRSCETVTLSLATKRSENVTIFHTNKRANDPPRYQSNTHLVRLNRFRFIFLTAQHRSFKVLHFLSVGRGCQAHQGCCSREHNKGQPVGH